MVISDESDITKQSSVMEPKKYVIVKNHVRELPTLESFIRKAELSPEGLLQGTKVRSKKNKRKSKTVLQQSSSENDPSSSLNSIDQSDLDELRSVYNNCKAVIKKIELKYGHLLNLDTETDATVSKKRKLEEESPGSENEPCACKLNNKILFDEFGNETTSEAPQLEHICPQKLQRRLSIDRDRPENVAVEYSEVDETSLPDELSSLSEILRDTELEMNYRNIVIKKYNRIKSELKEEISSNKASLVEQLKTNPDDVLHFPGSNLASLQGYKIK